MSKAKWVGILPPKTRNQTLIDSCTPEEAILSLTRYLSGELFISRKKKRAANISPLISALSYPEKLISSIALMSRLVMRKYAELKDPGRERLEIWRKGLLIADCLESAGELPPKREFYFESGTLGFTCRIYRTDRFKRFIILEKPPETVSRDLFVSPAKADLPGHVKSEVMPIGKIMARSLILDCLIPPYIQSP